MTKRSSPAPADHDSFRRGLLGALGSAGALLGLAGAGVARAQARGQAPAGAARPAGSAGAVAPEFNAYDRTKSFQNGEMNETPWVATQHGQFDLADPAQGNLARLKMTTNLVGRRTYIPMLVRVLLGRENKPGGLLLGGVGMFTWQLVVPDPKRFPNLPRGTALIRSMYTARYLDPATMEPVDSLRNPYNGKVMKLEDSLFVENMLNFPKGGTRSLEEAQFANDDPDKPVTRLIKRWGDELVLFQGGTYSEPGLHQPRFTENMWGSPYDEVMNPDVPLVHTNYSFTGLNKAYEKPWAGYTKADADIFSNLAYGKKVHSPEALPDLHKRLIAEKYPDRL